MKVLMSLSPECTDKIFAGVKKYEYRKSLFKQAGIDTVIIYTTAPVSKITGEFTFDQIISNDPENIWQQTKNDAGLTETDFENYFKNKKSAHALCIKKVKKYEHPIELKTINIKQAPQSFCYVN